MCDVTRHNFEEILPRVQNCIQNCNFVAIDTEFSALSIDEAHSTRCAKIIEKNVGFWQVWSFNVCASINTSAAPPPRRAPARLPDKHTDKTDRQTDSQTYTYKHEPDQTFNTQCQHEWRRQPHHTSASSATDVKTAHEVTEIKIKPKCRRDARMRHTRAE